MTDKKNEFTPKESDAKMIDFGFEKIPENQKENQVKEVFDSVAEKYDLMNDILSFGMHRYWKKVTVNKVKAVEGTKILDIAGGTGDLSLMMAPKVGKSGEIWLTDINQSMLEVGQKRMQDKGYSFPVTLCDAEHLPFKDNTFDVITVAFGLRNMTHKDEALREMLRVCKPGGKVMVLEFSKVSKLLAPFYDFYSFKLMPWLGAKIAGDADSYRYLAESIRMHPDQKTLARMMEQVGYGKVEWHNLTFGITALHIGYKY